MFRQGACGWCCEVYKLSSNETRSAPVPRPSRPSRRRPPIWKSIRTVRRWRYAGDRRCSRPEPANIICGNGSDELLGLLCHVYLGAGDEAIITEHGFLVYKIQIMGAGAKPVTVKETDCTVNVDAISMR